MATEKNPFEKIREEVTNVVQMPTPEEGAPTFEMEDDGGITVDFSQTSIEMKAEQSIQEWYGDLTDTVEEESQQILSIRRNYKKDDKNQEKVSHFVHYRFVPGFSFYGFGLMHFLGNLTMTATAAMRSLVDAGQFANLPGGFKAKGVRT